MVPRATLPLLLAIGAPAAAMARCSGANCPAWPAAVHIEGSYKEMSPKRQVFFYRQVSSIWKQ